MRVRVEQCTEADAEHRESKRQYAHVFHRPGVICVARGFHKLPETTRLGLLLHEVGHLLAGDRGGERDANRAAREHSGVTVRYKDGAYGKRLEYVRVEDKARVREFLGL